MIKGVSLHPCSPGRGGGFPADGAELTTETTDVAGRVGDLLAGFMGLTVQIVVNGDTENPIDAEVDIGIGNNGTFFAAGLPLVVGPNLITATATDIVENSISKEISISLVEIPRDAPQMFVESGNAQTGPVT